MLLFPSPPLPITTPPPSPPKMSDPTATSPPPITDPLKSLHLNLNSDGTLTRDPDSNEPTPVLSKDIPLNPSTKTFARIYLPREALNNSPPSASKLPLIIYFHGGGFISHSPDSVVSHNFCINVAAEIPAVLVSAGYRLAPEHRLPAAYDDAVEAILSIKSTTEDWIIKFADFSKCFLMGSSSGGNIAYHAGLRAAGAVDEFQPLRIQGLILHVPFFGGLHRSNSELKMMNDPILPPVISDMMWDLSLPAGADRDHEYCNPTAGDGSKVGSMGWRVLVIGNEGDPLVDRQREVVKLMEEKGVEIVGNFFDGGCHAAVVFDEARAKATNVVFKNFISSSNP